MDPLDCVVKGFIAIGGRSISSLSSVGSEDGLEFDNRTVGGGGVVVESSDVTLGNSIGPLVTFG